MECSDLSHRERDDIVFCAQNKHLVRKRASPRIRYMTFSFFPFFVSLSFQLPFSLRSIIDEPETESFF